MTLNSLVGLALSGFAGGVLLGWISVGIDITIFLILSALYKVDSRKATVTSILVIGWTSVFPLLYHIIDKKVRLSSFYQGYNICLMLSIDAQHHQQQPLCILISISGCAL